MTNPTDPTLPPTAPVPPAGDASADITQTLPGVATTIPASEPVPLPGSDPNVLSTQATFPTEAPAGAPGDQPIAVTGGDPTAPGGVLAQPVQSQPVQSQPVQTQPVQTQPVQTQPVQTQPVQTTSTVDTPAPQDDKAKLLPFYLVCDVSQSMVESGALTEANNILPSLVQALEKDPIISDKVRFGVVDFSDDARVALPLCDLLEQTSLPLLEGRGRTSYKAAFELLRTQIEHDVNQLKADGYAVHRPAVFFLSDGAPTDPEHEWKAAFTNLTEYDKASGQGNRMYPNIIPFGLQGADPRMLQEVIHPKNPPERAMRLFMADQDQTPASAVTKMAKLLVTSVIQSSTGMAQGGNGIVLPSTEEGIKSYAADDDVFL